MYAKIKFLILLLLLCALGYAGYHIHVFQLVSPENAIQIMQKNAWVAIPATIGLFICASLLPIPSTPLILASGAVFGPVHGSLYALIGEVLGAYIAFMLARVLGEQAVERWIRKSERIYAYERRLKHRGVETTVFLRLLPIVPLAPLNYALGLTNIRFTQYALGSLIGLFAVTFAYTYIGEALVAHTPQSITFATLMGAAFLLATIGAQKLSECIHDDGARA